MAVKADLSTVKDPIDRAIIRRLLIDARISWQALGREVSLSANATAERVRRLEQQGIISGYRAELNQRALGRSFDVVIGLRARPDHDRVALEAWLRRQPCITEAVHLTGAHDYLVRALCRDTTELDDLLMAMKAEGGVAETETRVVLRHLDLDPPASEH